ncbi:MAG: transporter substrate-binding domain-containing protein, partial [Lachnospiraceae bacterium]
KKDNEIVAKVNDAIKALKADGTFDKILASYIGETAGKDYYEVPADADTTKGELVMATNAEFPPYEYYEGEEIKGIDADFAKAIAAKLGMSLKIEDMAFDSIITAVQGGKADFGAAGMTVTDERKSQVDFSDSYYTGRQVIIVSDK